MPRINPTLPADGDTAVVEPYNAAITAILGVLNGAVDQDNLADGAVTLSKLATAVQAALVPTGMLAPFGGSSAPTGWLMCDGSSYLRASYSSLFAVLGTNYGSADGTHFNVPDLRGRVPVGNDAMGGTAANRIQRSTTLTTTSGSPTATVGSATGLALGMIVVNANVPAGTTITAISGTTLTLSANATGTGSAVTARFSMLGNDAQVLGGAGGEDVHTLTGPELPDIDLEALASAGGGASRLDLVGTGNTGWNTGFIRYRGGGNHIHNNTQPSVVTNYIIKT